MANGVQMETVTDFIFLGTKITADGDCRREMKRRLLLGRKAMTKPNSILKSRDITLPLLSFCNGPYAGLICLEMVGNHATDFNLQYISSNSTFSYNVITFLCFLGALPTSLATLCMGPTMLLKVYGTALNTMKNM